ncbi:MAG TPA: amidohydrolase [Candidatus Angelobacter sp.]|nr:amidohydrolase [Candidatus Angelobacter sp.]
MKNRVIGSSGDQVIGKSAKLTLPIGLKKLNKREPNIFSASQRLRGKSSFSDSWFWVSDHPITRSPDHPIHDTISICKYIFCSLLLFCSLAPAQGKPAADLIITNAKIWTVDKGHPQAEALAVLRDRIVAVGSSTEVDAWHGPQTKILDAQGKLLLPGFNDAHVHFVDGGDHLQQVQLKDAASPEEFARRIGARAKITGKAEWVTGGDWDEQKWSPPNLPAKELIDPVTANVPVWVNRYDGHESLANSAALQLAGITAKTPDPPGGEIVHDAQGNPTGILRDSAQDLVAKVMPPISRAHRMKAIHQALEHAASLGVTSVQDMNPAYDDVKAYSELQEQGGLTTRIYVAPLETGWKDQAKLGVRHGFGPDFLRMGAIKGYADGSLGSETAYFFEAYNDAPGKHGLLSDEMHPPSAMLQRLKGADAAGLQLCIHAIGDRAISMMLDMFEQIEKNNGKRDRRWRIEHSQHLAAKDFARYARLGVIASVQPYHAIDDGRWAESRIGADRIKRTYAFRTFLENGVRLAFGTDWSVAPLSPAWNIYAAVTRATLDGKNSNGWVPEQKLTVSEAVEAYTMGSAYAEFQEKEKGSITPGKLADFVVLSDNIFKIPPASIKNVKVEATFVGGKLVYGGLE